MTRWLEARRVRECARFLSLFTALACAPANPTLAGRHDLGVAAAAAASDAPGRPEAPARPGVKLDHAGDLAGSWADWQHASGTWAGTRPWMESRGVTLEIVYTGEVFDKLHGGIGGNNDAEYRGNLDLTVALDSGRLGLWPGATVFVYFENGHGSGVTTEHVGAVQLLSNLEARDFTQISEYWVEQRFFGDMFRVKLGKQDTNIDFCLIEYGTHFINSSFALIPTVPMPTFPDPALGASLFVDPTEWLSVGAGIYDGDPSGGRFGFESTFDGKGGQFAVLQVALSTSLLGHDWLPGTYRLGLWEHTRDVAELSVAPTPHKFSENHGVYLAFDQLLLAEGPETEPRQGLGAFVQFGWAPEDRNRLSIYLGAGLAYTGILPRRGDDLLGAGVAHVRFSDRVEDLEGLTDETIVEVFYEAFLTPWLTLQPDIQFVFNPGGDGRDAFVAGFRFSVGL